MKNKIREARPGDRVGPNGKVLASILDGDYLRLLIEVEKAERSNLYILHFRDDKFKGRTWISYHGLTLDWLEAVVKADQEWEGASKPKVSAREYLDIKSPWKRG